MLALRPEGRSPSEVSQSPLGHSESDLELPPSRLRHLRTPESRSASGRTEEISRLSPLLRDRVDRVVPGAPNLAKHGRSGQDHSVGKAPGRSCPRAPRGDRRRRGRVGRVVCRPSPWRDRRSPRLRAHRRPDHRMAAAGRREVPGGESGGSVALFLRRADPRLPKPGQLDATAEPLTVVLGWPPPDQADSTRGATSFPRSSMEWRTW